MCMWGRVDLGYKGSNLDCRLERRTPAGKVSLEWLEGS